MVDAHCHLTAEKAGAILKDVIYVTNGTNIRDSQMAVELTEKYENVWACIGVHPENISETEGRLNEVKIRLQDLINRRKVIGIGEVGLDYFQGITDSDKDKQKKLLEVQLALALENNLPVVIHNRAADIDTFEMINRFKVTGMMHCFTRNMEFMKKCTEYGWYISFGGFVMGSNNSRTAKVAQAVPEDKLLLETDTPYSGVNVKIVASVMAELRQMSEAAIDQVTSNNAKNLFKRMI